MIKNQVAKTAASQRLRKLLNGPVVAMTTPFKEDLSLDLEGLRRLTDYYAESGIKTVIAAGSTGEFQALSDEERQTVIRTVVERNRGRMAVIGCAAHSGTELALKLTRFCQESGCEGVMLTPPYYGFSGFSGLKKHYRIISDATDIGIVVYFSASVLRFPVIQGIVAKSVFQCPEEIVELMSIPNVGAFKDASGNYRFHCDVCRRLDGPGGIVSVMGSAGMGYHYWGRRFGSSCFLTGIGNIWPQIELEFHAKLNNDDDAGALKIVNEIDLPYLHAAASTGKYFAAVKALLDAAGMPGGPMRPPHEDLSEAERKTLTDTVKKMGLI
jgi:4-hydroxy-tetrahydrodipicolinate synthase